MHEAARMFAEEYPHLVGGVGLYPSFVHFDTRETTRLVVWHGRRPRADQEAS